MPIAPVSENFLFMYGSAMSGSQGRLGGIVDIGLGVFGAAMSGSLAYGGGITDIALLVRGNGQSGSIVQSAIEEDVIFTVDNIYGSAHGGALASMRLFIDPSVPEFNRYLPEGQSS